MQAVILSYTALKAQLIQVQCYETVKIIGIYTLVHAFLLKP